MTEEAIGRFVELLGADAVLTEPDDLVDFRDPFWIPGDDTYAAIAPKGLSIGANIDLDPKYGRWSQGQLAFCVPEGCRAGGQSVVPPPQSSQSGG